MRLSAAELYEAGLALPPSVRKDVALRLLESVEVVDQETIDQAWTDAISDRVDDIVSGKVETIPGEQVFAELPERRAARQAARNA
jgi:putative addiction module component (TIGR02574 family)